MTLEGTPDIVSPSGVAGLDFLDEAETADRYADELRRLHGVRAVVVLLHEGGVQSAPAGINECNGISGPIVDIVNRTTGEVDLFITGHTHTAYDCVIDGRAVTQRELVRPPPGRRRSARLPSVEGRGRGVRQQPDP
jgi:5'-nucleotidase